MKKAHVGFYSLLANQKINSIILLYTTQQKVYFSLRKTTDIEWKIYAKPFLSNIYLTGLNQNLSKFCLR